jgi:hypothetical protein
LSVHRALERLRSARFAPALSCPAAVAQIQAQCGLDLSKARVRCGFSRGHLLDIVVYLPGGLGVAREGDAVEDLVRLLLGEELFERWVGSVSATPTVRGGPLTVLNVNAEERSALPVASLFEAVAAAIAGLRLGLSSQPLSTRADTDDWVLFELTPEPAADYAAQDDLLFTSTRMPELKKSYLRGERFFSGRFANSGELFTFLKYESLAATGEARLAEREALEGELNRYLEPAHGALVGAGLGIRYVYLDLALKDPNCVAEVVIPALRRRSIGRQAWLLFCDSELDREWIGVHPDTPEPFWG